LRVADVRVLIGWVNQSNFQNGSPLK
jgi:hypothetical protein